MIFMVIIKELKMVSMPKTDHIYSTVKLRGLSMLVWKNYHMQGECERYIAVQDNQHIIHNVEMI